MKYFTFLGMVFFLLSCASKTGVVQDTAKQQVDEVKQETSSQQVTPGREETLKTAEETVKDAKTAVPSGEGITCKYGASDVRTLTVNKPEAGGCEVVYEKNGTPNVIGNAKSDINHCSNLAERVKTNLVNAGFTCN